MKIAIVGSRDYKNLQLVYDFVTKLPEGTVIISGGAHGVDATAEMVARFMNFEVVVYKPDWTKDRYAGHARNTLIVESCDSLWAFWNGRSRGTWDSIRKARDRGVLTAVRLEDGSFMNWQKSLWLDQIPGDAQISVAKHG